MVSWSLNALIEKQYHFIKDNFNHFHFSIDNQGDANKYLEILNKELRYNTLLDLIKLIPKSEINIDLNDLRTLEYNQSKWSKINK